MIADLILILMIALCIFLGYKRGLIKVALGIIGFIVSLVVALILYIPISNYIIENTTAVQNIKSAIESNINFQGDIMQENEDENLPESIQNYISKYTNEVAGNAENALAEVLAVSVVRIITWICLFIIMKFLMLFLRIFSDIVAEIPIIKQFNKAGRNSIWSVARNYNCIYSSWNS